MNRALLGLACALVGGVALADEATWAKKPEVTADGEKVRIQFAVTAPTDIEVAILDGEGKVVRHLAAGVVGTKEAAATLKAESLSQSLVWDRTDDLGRPAAGEKFSVRVRTGMKVAFGRTVGGSPYVVSDVRGIATDKDGHLYLMSQAYRAGGGKSAGPRYIQVFSRDGKYIKSIMPYPPDLKREEVASSWVRL